MAVQTPVERTTDVPAYPIWRLSVEKYHQMIAAGILTEDDPVELLEGWLVSKVTKNRPHSLSTQLTREALAQIVPEGWYVDDQEPITMADSEPEPDVMVVQGSRRDHTEQPTGDKVALVVEVSEAILQQDRTLKLRVYAAARIPAYWILNLQDKQLEIYTHPTGTSDKAFYRRRDLYAEGDDAPVDIDGREAGRVKVGELV